MGHKLRPRNHEKGALNYSEESNTCIIDSTVENNLNQSPLICVSVSKLPVNYAENIAENILCTLFIIYL